MDCKAILARLGSMADPSHLEGMAGYGIRPAKALGGISMPMLRKMAKDVGADHELAQQLWSSGVHEARLLAALIDDPGEVTPAQADAWAEDFDSWDVCDQCCANLFDRTHFAYEKAVEWSEREEEFVKRAGFALMAALAVHDKRAEDARFESFLPIIAREAGDERNYVRKAVNWALRQIGKRNMQLNRKAVRAARGIQKLDSRSARWIAADALRELTGEAVQMRLRGKRVR